MNKALFAIPLFLLVLTMPVYAEQVIDFDWTHIIIDAPAIENNPTTNYGSLWYAPILDSTAAGISGYYKDSYYYIMLDISDLPADAAINSATLHMWAYSSNGGNHNWLVYNTTLAWNNTNITWNAKPSGVALLENHSVTTTTGWHNVTITGGIQSSLLQGKNSSIMIRVDSNGSTLYRRQVYTKDFNNSDGHSPYFTINFSTTNNCNTTVIGSYCDPVEIAASGRTQTIITAPDYTCANDQIYICPTGSWCTQITPQVNITTPLIENFTDCSKCTYTYTTALGFFPIFLWTNCQNNPECLPVLGNQSNVFTSSCLWGPANPLIVTCPSTFTTPTSEIPGSAYYYTAGCYNPSLGWVPVVIDQNGNQTTILNLTQDIFGENTTLATPHREDCPANTTSLCYNDACQQVTCQSSIASVSCSSASGYTDQLVCAVGGMLGVSDIGNSKFISSILFSFIIAIAVLAALNYYGVSGESMGMVFIMSLLMLTIMFTFIGWFPSWIMIILMVLGALMVAKMLRVV